MGRALVEQADVRLALEPRAHFPHQTRLADPGLAGQQDDMPLAVFGLLPSAQQQRDLLVTADQRRQARRLPRLEAPFGLTLAFDPPGGKRLGEALEPPGSEVVELEHAAEQPARRLADHHRCRAPPAPAVAPPDSASRRPPSAPAPHPRRSARRP